MAHSLFGSSTSRSRLWGTDTQDTKGEIDLRAELHEILFGSASKPQRGHWVIYKRFDLSKKSDNFDEVYNEGVGGTANPFVETLVMTRRDPVFSRISFEKNEARTPMGLLEGENNGYYFEHSFRPRIQDQIFEIEWDDHKTKPILSQFRTPETRIEKFNIKEVFPYRSDGGRIEYWIVYVNLDLVSY